MSPKIKKIVFYGGAALTAYMVYQNFIAPAMAAPVAAPPAPPPDPSMSRGRRGGHRGQMGFFMAPSAGQSTLGLALGYGEPPWGGGGWGRGQWGHRRRGGWGGPSGSDGAEIMSHGRGWGYGNAEEYTPAGSFEDRSFTADEVGGGE